MSNELALYHGWGFSSAVWSEVGEVYDRGYFASPRELNGLFETIVVHSMGLYFVPLEQLKKAKRIIFLSSFLDFTYGDRRRQKLLLQMQRKMESKPAEVLADFYHLCGYNGSADRLNAARLLEDLAKLEDPFDVTAFPASQEKLIYHGTLDEVVPVSAAHHLHEQLPGSSLQLISTGHYGTVDYCKEFLEK